MEAKNFRIGNWISTEKGDKQVESIDETGIIDVETIDHDGFYYYNYQPIPISPEWLKRFGFVKDNNGNYWIDLQTHYLELMPSNGYWYPVYAQVPEMSHEDEQRVSTNRIEFVHELQNLFFALTGNELEMKV